MDFTFVFTFPERYSYALKNVRCAEKFLPKNGNIIVQYEGKNKPDDTDRIRYIDFDLADVKEFQSKSQEFVSGKVSRKSQQGLTENGIYNKPDMWMWDAGRFCYKVYAMLNTLPMSNRYLCYIDSDVIFEKNVPEDFFYTLFEEGMYASYLNREQGRYLFPDTGYIGFDTHHPSHDSFWNEMRKLYDGLELFKIEDGWTDCHALRHCIQFLESNGIPSKKLIDPTQKISWDSWKLSPLSKYCTHHKGDYFHKPSGV